MTLNVATGEFTQPLIPAEEPKPPDEKTTTQLLLECVCGLEQDIEELRKIVASL